MSYLLIGNISALICNDCVEPLANARIRVYLPATHAPVTPQPNGIFNDMQPLSAREVLMKADRLLAETTLDEKGGFCLSWNEVHLFTEALELDLCLDQLPGKNGNRHPRNYHLSRLVLPWKRNSTGYVGAYAYVIPAALWQNIYSSAGAWLITGVVKPYFSAPGQPHLKVEAYNALSGRLLGIAHTDESGRYFLHFSGNQVGTGRPQAIISGRKNLGPDVYFKVYRNNHLLWAEDERMGLSRERRDIAPCSNINLIYKSSKVKRASDQIGNWFSEIITLKGTRKSKSDKFRLITQFSLL